MSPENFEKFIFFVNCSFSTLVSLMMVELWKEIELEYVNSKIHAFTTVTINDKNLEKRGDGRRMVFHCQGTYFFVMRKKTILPDAKYIY